MSWIIETTLPSPADVIMQKDAHLLNELQAPVLHFYEWEKEAATYGCFTRPEKLLNMDAVKALNLDLAKRPTGGGIVFHISDLAFSVLIPENHPQFSINTLENYALINEQVAEAIKELNINPILLPQEPTALDESCRFFCMAKPTKYDLMVQGKKMGGASQRRTKKGFLHQGTISIALLPNTYLEQVLLPGTRVLEAMMQNSASLLPLNASKKEIEEMRVLLKQSLKRSITSIN